jgi:chromosome segregation ATPase
MSIDIIRNEVEGAITRKRVAFFKQVDVIVHEAADALQTFVSISNASPEFNVIVSAMRYALDRPSGIANEYDRWSLKPKWERRARNLQLISNWNDFINMVRRWVDAMRSQINDYAFDKDVKTFLLRKVNSLPREIRQRCKFTIAEIVQSQLLYADLTERRKLLQAVQRLKEQNRNLTSQSNELSTRGGERDREISRIQIDGANRDRAIDANRANGNRRDLLHNSYNREFQVLRAKDGELTVNGATRDRNIQSLQDRGSELDHRLRVHNRAIARLQTDGKGRDAMIHHLQAEGQEHENKLETHDMAVHHLREKGRQIITRGMARDARISDLRKEINRRDLAIMTLQEESMRHKDAGERRDSEIHDLRDRHDTEIAAVRGEGERRDLLHKSYNREFQVLYAKNGELTANGATRDHNIQSLQARESERGRNFRLHDRLITRLQSEGVGRDSEIHDLRVKSGRRDDEVRDLRAEADRHEGEIRDLRDDGARRGIGIRDLQEETQHYEAQVAHRDVAILDLQLGEKRHDGEILELREQNEQREADEAQFGEKLIGNIKNIVGRVDRQKEELDNTRRQGLRRDTNILKLQSRHNQHEQAFKDRCEEEDAILKGINDWSEQHAAEEGANAKEIRDWMREHRDNFEEERQIVHYELERQGDQIERQQAQLRDAIKKHDENGDFMWEYVGEFEVHIQEVVADIKHMRADVELMNKAKLSIAEANSAFDTVTAEFNRINAQCKDAEAERRRVIDDIKRMQENAGHGVPAEAIKVAFGALDKEFVELDGRLRATEQDQRAIKKELETLWIRLKGPSDDDAELRAKEQQEFDQIFQKFRKMRGLTSGLRRGIGRARKTMEGDVAAGAEDGDPRRGDHEIAVEMPISADPIVVAWHHALGLR